MKFHIKKITAAVAIAILCAALCFVIIKGVNSNEDPSNSEVSNGLDNKDETETENITIDDSDKDSVAVGSESESTEEDSQEEIPEDTQEDVVDKEQEWYESLSDLEREWLNYLMANDEVGLNIRAEASTEAEVVGRLRKGDKATIVEIGEEWTKIQSGVVEGYVHNDYCLFGLDALSLAQDICDTVVVCMTDELCIRAEESQDSVAVDLLLEGKELKVDLETKTSEDWVAVIFNGQTRYVAKEYVEIMVKVNHAITIEEAYAIEDEKLRAEEAARQEAARLEALANAKTEKEYAATFSDLDLLAALIYCEAGGEPYEAQLGVGSVVMNRLKKGHYGKRIVDVIYQADQFMPSYTGVLKQALANKSATESCYQAAAAALAGTDNTNGALYFDGKLDREEGVKYGRIRFYYVWSR